MFSRRLGRPFVRPALLSARRRRLKREGLAAADVLESRVLLSASAGLGPAAGKTLQVDPSSTNPAVYHTIQAAVNAAAAGNTILVAPGTYNEDVTVSKSLTILGGQVLAPGESGPSILEYEATGFTVSSANKVTISGFTIEADPVSNTSTGDAIVATNSAHSQFESNIAVGSVIELEGGVTSTVVANDTVFSITVTSTGPSNANDTFQNNSLSDEFYLDGSATGALVVGNELTNTRLVVGFQNFADDVTFVDNTVSHALYGFYSFGNNDTLIGNTADNNPGNRTSGNVLIGGVGFDLGGGGTLTVVGNTADNNVGEGMRIGGAITLTLMSNTADSNHEPGIQVVGTTATVLFNTANNNVGEGFRIDQASLTLIGNVANGNVPGDDLTGSGFQILSLAPGATIIGNTANNNFDAGLVVAFFTQGTVFGNTTDNNGRDGIAVVELTDSTLSFNTADNNGRDGFQVQADDSSASESSSGNTFSHNTADNNANDGFDVDAYSTDNVFIGNTATGNTVFDLSDASTGSGTAGTGNTWTNNTANTANPAGIL